MGDESSQSERMELRKGSNGWEIFLKRWGLRVLILVAWVTAWLLIPRALLSAAKKKFPIGTTIQEAEARLNQPFYIYTNSATSNPRARYQIFARGNRLFLNFDENAKLIGVESVFEHK